MLHLLTVIKASYISLFKFLQYFNLEHIYHVLERKKKQNKKNKLINLKAQYKPSSKISKNWCGVNLGYFLKKSNKASSCPSLSQHLKQFPVACNANMGYLTLIAG